MQNQTQLYYKKRSIFYASRAISRQGEAGDEWKYNIKPVYCISFLNFTLDSISTEFRTDIALMDMSTGKHFSDDMRLIYLQLPRFTKSVEECETLFDKWIYVLRHMSVLERLPKEFQSDIFKILDRVTDIASLTKEEWVQYDYALKRYRDTLGMIAGAEEEGRQKGIQEGRAEGIQIGEEKGRQESARNLKALGASWEMIQAATGLTIEEIERL